MNMALSELMQRNFMTVAADDSIDKIERLFRLQRRAFAVVLDADNNYCGLIPASHLLGFQLAWKSTGALKAAEICVQRVVATHSQLQVREAAELLLRKNADYLVAMEAGQVKGIVPVLAVLRELLQHVDSARPLQPQHPGRFAGPT